MSVTIKAIGEVQAAALRGFKFRRFQPDDVPGYESNIATVLGRSPNQTRNLLEAVDALESLDNGNHWVVTPRELRPAGRGENGEVIPAEYEVTVRAG